MNEDYLTMFSDSEGAWTWDNALVADQPIPERDYLVRPVFSMPVLGMFYGSPGCGKTFLLLDLALSIASGENWLDGEDNDGYTSVKSPILWLNQDTPRYLMHERMQAIMKGKGITTEDIKDNFYMVHNPQANFNSKDYEKQYQQTINNIRLALLRTKAKLLVIDNLGSVSGGLDENTSHIMPVVNDMRWLSDKFSCAVLLVHHENKAGGYRGFSGILATVDTAINVKKDGGKIALTTPGKVRDLPLNIEIKMTVDMLPGGEQMDKAQFYKLSDLTQDNTAGSGKNEYEKLINGTVTILGKTEKLNQSDLIDTLKRDYGITWGKHKIISKLNTSALFKTTTGARNAKLYELSDKGYDAYTREELENTLIQLAS